MSVIQNRQSLATKPHKFRDNNAATLAPSEIAQLHPDQPGQFALSFCYCFAYLP